MAHRFDALRAFKNNIIKSFGILLYRPGHSQCEVLLLHPGGPFFAKKDAGAWSIPKGLAEEGEEPLSTALREFKEETGTSLEGRFTELKPVKLKGGKIVQAFACKGDFDTSQFVSNEFELEWPPRSGKKKKFPEADKAQWFSLKEARTKINQGQLPLLEELEGLIG